MKHSEPAGNTYNNDAVHHVSMTPNESNKGVIPTLSFLDRGLIVSVPNVYQSPTYNDDGTPNLLAVMGEAWDADHTFVSRYCECPVWLVYYLLTNSTNGIAGRSLDAINIDLDSFFDASYHNCYPLTDAANTEIENNRYTFNYQITTQSEVWDQCNNILASCQAKLFWYGDTIHIIQDRAVDVSDYQEILSSDIIDITYSGRHLNDVYTSTATTFVDRENNWATKTVIIDLPDGYDGLPDKIGDRSLPISLTGVTNESQARRLSLFALIDSVAGVVPLSGTVKVIAAFAELTVGFSKSQLKPGQVIEIKDDDVNPLIGATYRIESIDNVSESEFKLFFNAL